MIANCVPSRNKGDVAPLGRHVILEMWGCCNNAINSVDGVKESLAGAASVMKATLIDVVCHCFSPYGITGVAILAESHISVHTWPEHGYAAVDIFICSSTTNPMDAASFLAQRFQAKETSQVEFKRGNFLSKDISLPHCTFAP